VLISATWVKACGKFPASRRRTGSYCSDRSPTSFRRARRRSGGVESAPADLLVHVGPEPSPALGRPLAAKALDRLHRTIERNPRHDLRVREVAARPAHLPDALVGKAPGGLEEVHERELELPRFLLGVEPLAPRDVQRVEHLAVHVELELVDGGVPDAHRPRAVVARQPRDLVFGDASLPGRPVEDTTALGASSQRPWSGVPRRAAK